MPEGFMAAVETVYGALQGQSKEDAAPRTLEGDAMQGQLPQADSEISKLVEELENEDGEEQMLAIAKRLKAVNQRSASTRFSPLHTVAAECAISWLQGDA